MAHLARRCARTPGAYGRYEDERASLPTEQQYLEAHRPHGLGGRVGSALKLAGRLLVQSSLNPIVAAEGLAIGGLDKDANARFSYRHDVEPRSVARQQRHLSDAGRELGMTNLIDDNARADEQLQMAGEQHAAGQARQAQIDAEHSQEWQERLQEKTLNDWMARNPGVPIPTQMAERSGHPYLAGYVPPAKKSVNARTPQVRYNEKTGQVGVVTFDEHDNPTLLTPGADGSWSPSSGMQPTPDAPTHEPFENYTSRVGPEAYGVKSWNDLVPNPDYAPAYQQALESAKAVTEPGKSPEDVLRKLVAVATETARGS